MLKRKVLTEEEFAKANQAARSQKAELEKRKAEPSDGLKQVRATEALAEKVPEVINNFEEAFR